MSTKDEILQRLRSNTREQYEMPDLSQLTPITFDDPVAEFIRKTTTIAGAKLLEMKADDSLDAVVHKAYPDAKIIASNIPGVKAQLNPDTATVEELEKADVGVIEGACRLLCFRTAGHRRASRCHCQQYARGVCPHRRVAGVFPGV